MTDSIVRSFPKTYRHSEMRFYNISSSIIQVYPRDRFSEEDLIEYGELKRTEEFKKWYKGINPETDREIGIEKATHEKIRKKLGYKYHSYYRKIRTIKNIDEYIEETKKINREEREYSKLAELTRKQISGLKWNEFVEFRGVKYGIEEFYNYIHRRNDCGGEMIQQPHIPCTCHKCECWYGCGEGSATYKCNKCEATFSRSFERNYKGK